MFKSNYNNPGKGIPKDIPKKKGFALFAEIFIREFWTLVSLNVLFIFASIPVVTVGAAYGAMYHVIIKMMRDEPVDLTFDFKYGFKRNWKQSTQVYFITIFSAIILYVAYIFYGNLHSVMYYIMNSILFYMCMAYIYVFPMLVSVELNLKNLLKNSISLSVISLWRSILASILLITMVFITLLFFPVSIFYIFFIGMSFTSFVMGFFAYYAIHKYVEFHEDTTENLSLETTAEEI
ncbi:MAG: DUF624 domain-containing protein [Bacillota bacterium]